MEKRKQPAYLFGFWGDRHIPEPSCAKAGIHWRSKEASVPACVGLQKFNAGRGSAECNWRKSLTPKEVSTFKVCPEVSFSVTICGSALA